MLVLILLTVAAVTTINTGSAQECPTCLLVNRTCYNTTYLFNLNGNFRNQANRYDNIINKIGILRSTNQLFYSFQPEFNDKEYYKTGFVNLDDPSSWGIIVGPQVFNFRTFDINQDSNKIYLGGSDGIFLLETGDKMSSFTSKGDTISNVFYKTDVYYTREDHKGIIVKSFDSYRTLVQEIIVKTFILNKSGVLVYLNNTGLYLHKGNTLVTLSKYPFYRGLTVDLDDNVYTWWIDGIYKITIENELEKSKINKIVELPMIGTMTFDNENNIIFTSDTALYRMIPTDHGCGVTSTNQTKSTL